MCLSACRVFAIAPGSGKKRAEFTALLEEPTVVDARPGLNIVLETEDLFSLKAGDHVYYRKVQVGEITGYKLSKTFQKVLLNVLIYKPFVFRLSGSRQNSGMPAVFMSVAEFFPASVFQRNHLKGYWPGA